MDQKLQVDLGFLLKRVEQRGMGCEPGKEDDYFMIIFHFDPQGLKLTLFTLKLDRSTKLTT